MADPAWTLPEQQIIDSGQKFLTWTHHYLKQSSNMMAIPQPELMVVQMPEEFSSFCASSIAIKLFGLKTQKVAFTFEI